MATYRKVSRLVPSSQRTTEITNVDTGDVIDFKEILGRRARRIKISLPNNITSAQFRLNNKIYIEPESRLIGINEHSYSPLPTVEIVSEGAHHPLYTLAGNAEYYTEEGLSISFMQIVDVTTSSGASTVSVTCW